MYAALLMLFNGILAFLTLRPSFSKAAWSSYSSVLAPTCFISRHKVIAILWILITQTIFIYYGYNVKKVNKFFIFRSIRMKLLETRFIVFIYGTVYPFSHFQWLGICLQMFCFTLKVNLLVYYICIIFTIILLKQIMNINVQCFLNEIP